MSPAQYRMICCANYMRFLRAYFSFLDTVHKSLGTGSVSTLGRDTNRFIRNMLEIFCIVALREICGFTSSRATFFRSTHLAIKVRLFTFYTIYELIALTFIETKNITTHIIDLFLVESRLLLFGRYFSIH